MLQPMQPIGQQKPGMNMPQGQRPQMAPGQQTMPAGAAFQRGILPGGIASNPEDIKAAYGGTPQGQQKLQQAAGQGDYLSAIALSQILEEERERASAKAMPQEGGKPQPVVDRMRDEAVELRRQDLEEQQAKRLGMEQQRSQAGMAQMIQQAARPQMQGIAQLPAQNVAQPQAMAAGGIVAFNGEDGSVVEKVTEEVVRPVGADPYAGLTNKQILERFGREQLGANRQEAERRARDEYLKFAGYTPEERARREKQIAEMEAYDRQAYDPERLRNEGLAAFLMGAANTGGIGETLGRAGQSGLNYSNKMRELARQRMENRQKQAADWDEAQRGARVKGYEAGTAEGKEVLAGQRQGIAGLGDVLQYEGSLARTAASGAGSEGKAEARVANMIARDAYIQAWTRALTQMEKDQQVGTPEYNALQQKISDRQNLYYTRAGLDTLEAPPATEVQEPPKKPGLWDSITGFFGGESKPSGTIPAGAKFVGYAKGTTNKVYELNGKKYVEQ